MAALFNQISSQGLDITKSLRHVDDSEKAYKQVMRETRTVDEAEISARKRKKTGCHRFVPPSGPSKFELLDGKKWAVQFQHGADETSRISLEIPAPNKKEAVFIAKCYNLYLKISGKVNSVQVVESANVQIELLDTVGPVEVTASEGIELLIQGTVPNVIAGKVTGLTVHMGNDASMRTEFVTSCCNEVNVTYAIIDADGDRDRVEVSIPEQFTSSIGKRNKIVTTVVDHSSA